VNVTLDTALITDPGCQRDTNEDCVGIFWPENVELRAQYGTLAVVADGLGGHLGGEIASAMAVEAVRQVYFRAPPEDPLIALRAGIEFANTEVFTRSQQDISCAGMGCTFTALAIVGRAAFCAHVGDSRLYVRHAAKFAQISQDDTLVNELVRSGLLSKEEASQHPNRHRLSRALGVGDDFDYVTWVAPFELEPGDAFLLCSDGLHDLVSDTELAEALATLAPTAATKQLVELARERGGYDNISVAIVRVPWV
jgi:PPM family protein phosphatase